MLSCFKRLQEVGKKQKKDNFTKNYNVTPPRLLLGSTEDISTDTILEPQFINKTITECELEDDNAETPYLSSIEQLPDIVLGKIFSYLHWKEKEWFQLGIPGVRRIMNSPLAWDNFENDRNYAVEKLYMYICFPFLVDYELSVIKKYGRFFQSCTIWIHKVTFLDKERGNDFRLLHAIAQHCHHLKRLSIMHTSDISVAMLKTCTNTYLRPLQELAINRGKGFRLSLNRLFYASVESVQTGILSYLNCIQEKGLLSLLSCLDFSHGLICDISSNKAAAHLLQCVNLQTLKCPVQTLTTSVIIYLANKSLTELYVVNDDHTQQTCFVEKLFLDWGKIYYQLSMSRKNSFNVHYIFKNRVVCNKDMIPNPFLRSLIFDNLSSNISAPLLYHIANLYGQTMLNLAFCSNYWEFLMHFADLGKINESFKFLGRKCVKLKSFLSCLSLSSSALVSLVKNSKEVSTIRVYKENIRLTIVDKPEGIFLTKMAEALGTPRWDMVKKGDNIFIIPGVNCRLLFSSCFNEF